MEQATFKHFLQLLNSLKLKSAILMLILMMIISFSLKHLNNKLENEIIQENEIIADRLSKKVEQFLEKLLHETDLILDNKLQEAFWSQPFISPKTGSISSTLNFPTENGIVSREINLSGLNKLMEKITIRNNGYVLLTDDKGILIAHTAGDLFLGRTKAHFLFHVRPELAPKKSSYKHRIYGIKILSSIDIVSSVGWRVFATQPVGTIIAFISELVLVLCACTFIGIIIFIFAQIRLYQTSQSP